MRLTTVLIFLFVSFMSAFAQTSQPQVYNSYFIPETKTIFYQLGERKIPITLSQYGTDKKIVMVNLHSDELSSINGAKQWLKENGGLMIQIENNGQRNIRFRYHGKTYTFDPNRMFSAAGIEQTMTQLSKYEKNAAAEIEKFGQRLLELLPGQKELVIALHNNTNGFFGINSYTPGGERQHDAADVYQNKEEDPDDIFLTTDENYFKDLSAKNYNTILQDNVKARRDGSLSIYCGERNIKYINCETEHGKTVQYLKMLKSIFSKPIVNDEDVQKPDAYLFEITTGEVPQVNDSSLYFGDDKIGQLHITTVTENSITGEISFEKNFIPYSNMNFYFIRSENNITRFEIRVDPTQPKDVLRKESKVFFKQRL